jgi:hypothetical protein
MNDLDQGITMFTYAPTTRRGFAMLLVLISLAIATILATAYLASRDNSAMIGENIAAGTSAKWAALATLRAGIATLETETDWRTNHTNGVVFTNASLAGASVDLKFMDLASGNPPDSGSTDIEITATARVNNMMETVIAHAYVPPAAEDADLDLSEFAIFGKDQVTIRDASLVTRWTTSPKAQLGKPIAIGTSSALAGAISIVDNGVALDGVVFHVPTASSLIVSNTGPGEIHKLQLPDTIVVPDAPNSGVVKPLDLVIALWTDMSRNGGATFTITNDRNIQDLTITTGSTIFMRGPITVTVGDDLQMDTGGRIQVRGNVKLVVLDDVRMGPGTAIELEDGATLEMYVADDINLDDASINELGAGPRDTAGTATWMDPTRFKLYNYGSNSPWWELQSGSVIKGTIYAPNRNVRIEESSAVYGNVVADEVELRTGGQVYYDHSLDTGNGFTTFNGPVYGDDGLVKASVRAVTNLSQTIMGLLLGTPNPPAEPPPAGAPTPRTVKVTYEIVKFSNDVPRWELNASMVAVDD